MSETSESTGGGLVGTLTSGIIAAVIGAAVVLLLSLALPFPWDLWQTVISVAVASFFGAAASYIQGVRAGSGG